MRVASLKIQNFRGIREGYVQFKKHPVLIGDNNTVIGANNFVIGSNDSLIGDNSWVFASDYQSADPQNGVLVIELYLIELAKVPQIAYNPIQVIHCVNQEESNRQFNNFWKQATHSHRFSF